MDFTLDTKAAKAADQLNARITEAGKYSGVFTRAEAITSKKGSKGVEFSFKCDDGSTSDYLSVWTSNASGEQLAGFKAVMAMLTCMSLRGAKETQIEVEKYNFDMQQRERVTVPGYPDMMNRPIGLVLQKELYTKNNGGEGERMLIVGCYRPSDEFTASEILDKAVKPEVLAKQLQWLAGKSVKDSRTNATPGASAPAAAASSGGGFADFTDDIPFAPIGRGVAAYAI